MAKLKAMGTSLSYLPAYNSGDAVKLIGALSSIGEIALTSEEADVTALDSPGGYREVIQTIRDSGEIPLTGFHDSANAGQTQMRTLHTSGATGYFWITFPDSTVVAFTAFVKGHSVGAAEVGGAVGFGAVLRISGIVQIISPKLAVAQTKADGQTATVDSTATALTGTPTYQWYSNDTNNYTTPDIVGGATSATYTTGALSEGTYYYFCVITVSGYRAINSQIHVITVTA
jgi:hypothetical protein